MSLIRLRAKQPMLSEQNMELQGKYDAGNIATAIEWQWTDLAIEIDQIYKIMAYNKTKTVVILYETEEQILVSESFDSLYDRWNKLRNSVSGKEESEKTEDETV